MDAPDHKDAAPVSRRWYLLQCKPRECERALVHLGNQGYEAFLPTLTREVVRRGRRDVVREPLFPHYLFVRLSDVSDNWGPIRSTRGVTGLVRFGELPLPVPDSVVEALHQREVEVTGVPKIQTLFQPGDHVRIVEGPLAGLDAILSARDGTERVVLLIRLLHQTQELVLSVTQVQPLKRR